MKTLKRSVAVLLSILMLMSVLSVAGMTAFAEGNTYTVAGSSAAVFGTEWDNTNKANDMTDDDGDGVFDKTYENVPAGSYEFKIVENYNWDTSYGNNGQNVSFTVEDENATITIIFDSSSKTISISGSSSIPPADDTTSGDYYVVGELAGITWDAADAGKMTKNDDGSYTKTFTDVAAGSYQIKINNGSWDECYPSGDNWVVNVDADHSTVVVTLSADKNMNVEIVAPDTQEPSSNNGALNNKFVAIIYCEQAGTDDATRNTEVEFNADGTLTYNFIGDSYVFVRNYDTGVQYCTNGWSDFANPVTLVNEANLTSTFDKMYVPAGEHTLYLSDNGNDTYTLGYDTGAVTPSTPATDPSESTTPSDTTPTPTTPSTPENPAVYEVPVDAKADDTVTVKFTLQAAEKFVNGEGGLTYDSSVLQLEKFEFLNVTGSYYNTELHNEVLFNFTDAQNPADFTTAKDFVVVTFKALKDIDTAVVTLNLVELNATGTTDVPLVTDGSIVGEFTITAYASAVAPTEPTSETEPTTAPTEPTPAPKLSVKKKLNAGATTTAKVTNADGKKVTYKSTNTKVATVNKKTGKVTALAKGTAKIQAKVGNVTLEQKITVKTNPVIKNGKKTVKNNQTITVRRGKSLTLKVVGKAASIKNKIKNSKKTVAAVTSKKKATNITIKAKKVGTTTLTIKINNVKTYKVKIKVK